MAFRGLLVRSLALAGLAVSVCACGDRPESGAAPAPAPAQQAPPAPPPPSEYEAAKLVFIERLRELAKSEDGAFGEKSFGDEPPFIDLYHCYGLDQFMERGIYDDSAAPRLLLALEAAYLTLALEPYPRESWSADLARYEQQEIAHDDKSINSEAADERRRVFHELLKKQVNAARQGRNLPQVDIEGGCGAESGEVPVKFLSDPRGAQVMIIPTFFYDVCKARKINADDPGVCTRWREAIEGAPTPVSGDYYYAVRWADGITRRGKVSFTAESPDTLTLQKPR